MRHLLRTIALSVIVLTALRASAQPYKVKLERPDTVGTKFVMSATGINHQSALQKVGEQSKSQNEDYTVTLKGEAEVLGLTSRGLINKLSVKVESCDVQEAKDSQKQLVKPGSVIVAEGKGKGVTEILIDGKPAEGALAEKLQSVLAITQSEDATDADKMFGTTETRNVGDEWKPDLTQCAKELSQAAVQVPPESLSGNAKLVEVKDIAGKPHTVIQATIKAKDLKPDLPPTLKATLATAEITFTAVSPVDVKAPPHSLQMEVDFNMVASGEREDKKPLVFEVHRKTSSYVERTPK